MFSVLKYKSQTSLLNVNGHQLILNLSNPQVLFDHMGCLKRYDSVQDILKEFFDLRLQYYKLRKDWSLGSMGAEAAKLSNQARFVLEKIEGKISIGQNAGNSKYHILSEGLNKFSFLTQICFSANREQIQA